MSYLAGLAGTPGPGYFVDNLGHPKIWAANQTWCLPQRAGEWTSGAWMGDYDNFFSTRAGQGFTVLMTDPVAGTGVNAPNDNGNTWDGVTPMTGGTNPSVDALNNTFWTRIDYMFSSALSNNITIGLVLYDSDSVGVGAQFQNGWTNTQWTDWATKVGTRYASQANLVWLLGNDAFSPFADGPWGAILTGLAAASATQLVGIWYNPETTSRYVTDTDASEGFGQSHSAMNFVYTYNAGYFCIEYAYNEVTHNGAANLIPVIGGDGYFWNGGNGSPYDSTFDRATRQEWWWTFASGARGACGESEQVWKWGVNSAANLTGDWFFANNTANIISTFTGWTNWHKLLPDLTSAFVTAGRGTRVAGLASGGGATQYEPAFTNSYVAASITADGSLAVCYLPNATTITCTTSLLAAGYTAHWIDPVSGAATSAGGGTTFNSTAKGSNSVGDPDWVVVFQGPASSPGVIPVPVLYQMRRFP